MTQLLISLLIIINAQAMDQSTWKKMTKDEQINYLSQMTYGVDQNVIRVMPADFINEKIHNYLDNLEIEFDTEVHDEWHYKVGEVLKTYYILTSDQGEILGSYMNYHQQGCDLLDEDGEYDYEASGYFATMKEANQNNCFDHDVSWSGHAIYNHNGKELDNSGHMEWTGY